MSPQRQVVASAAMSAVLAGCAPIGLLFPYEVEEYYPKASWGELTNAGGCPSHTPALEVRAKNPDWLWVKVGIWDSYQSKRRKLKEPTLFIHVYSGWHLSIAEQKRRAAASISITSSTPHADMVLTDGSKKRIPLERFGLQDAWRTAPSDVPLDVVPQSMTVTFPPLVINGEPVPLGTVEFVYRKARRYPC